MTKTNNTGERIVVADKWLPSEEVFTAYKKREVELATENLRRNPRLSPHMDTLHSADTIEAALKEAVGLAPPKAG